MPVDSAAHIASLNAALPTGSDLRTEADNNFRHIKTVLVTDFPNIAGPVTATHTELNFADGVTSAIQPQLDAKAPLASPTFTGTPAAPTAAAGTATAQLATTAFTQTAIAAVNATTGLTRSANSAASFSVGAGQMIAATNAGVVAVTFPASPTVGTGCGVHFENGLATNTIDLGANGIKGPNGTIVTGVVTIDQLVPVLWFWYGDYWRAA